MFFQCSRRRHQPGAVDLPSRGVGSFFFVSMILFSLMGTTSPAQTEQLPASTDTSADDRPSPGAAEEQRPAEEIVVTAARRRRLRSEVPVSVTVIDGADLEQTAVLSLDDALRTVAGVGLPGRSSLVLDRRVLSSFSMGSRSTMASGAGSIGARFRCATSIASRSFAAAGRASTEPMRWEASSTS